MSYIYCDFEYNDRAVVLGCFLNSDTGERVAFDFRQPEAVDAFKAFVTANRNAVWCAYAAMAEMDSMLRLGLKLNGLKWIDLMAEASMISGTHELYLLKRPRLLNHLQTFGVRSASPEDEKRKKEMRDLIIYNDDWTDEEWADIVSYCWSDVEPLPKLHGAIRAVHIVEDTVYSDDFALTRGEYLKASAILEHRSTGLPVDAFFIDRIYRHREDVKSALAVRCNEYYGHPLYVYNHVSKAYSFSFAGLHAYLSSLPYELHWQRTDSGRLRLDDDYLEELIKANPELKEFKRTRNTMSQLNDGKLPSQIINGNFVKPVSLPFYTVTGRNQPLVSAGFILNMAPWLRHVVRPEPDHVLIAADWSKQEIGIAVALSGDPALREAYESEDVYLTLAKMANAVPADGKKQDYKMERDAYKTVQLGLGYGMGKPTLGRSLFIDLNEGKATQAISREECESLASTIFDWHKRTFTTYWKFLKSKAEQAKKQRWTSSEDGWLYFADKDSRFTRLMNFPMQSNGAVCLRESIKKLAFETDLNVVCTLHDAIYIYCHKDEAEASKAILKRIMNEAITDVIGDEIKVAVDFNEYTHETGYYDARGTKTLQVVVDLLTDIETNGAPLPPEKIKKERKKKPKKADAVAPDMIKFGEAA